METFRIEGVVLQALAVKEFDSILTAFTPHGIQKFYFKGSKRYNPLASPLTVAEFIYSPGKKDLHKLRDGSIIDQNLALRKTFESLISAENLSLAVLASQMPDKPVPHLYRLYRLFLGAIPFSPTPEALVTVFYIKLMKHEGVLQLQQSASLRYGGECFSNEEAPKDAVETSEEEENLLKKLAESRSLEEITSLILPLEFSKKIHLLFSQSFTVRQP